MQDQEEMTAGVEQAPGLTELTVNLTPAAWGALLEAAEATKDTRTDTVNRALLLYAFYTKQELVGWAPAMVRDDEVKTFRLE